MPTVGCTDESVKSTDGPVGVAAVMPATGWLTGRWTVASGWLLTVAGPGAA